MKRGAFNFDAYELQISIEVKILVLIVSVWSKTTLLIRAVATFI